MNNNRMTLDQVKITEKLKDIMHDNTQVIFAEGKTNAGKSFILGIKFFRRVYNSPAHHIQFVLAGKSLPVLEKMYIQNMTSFYNLHRPLCTYTAKGSGGAKIIVKTPTGEKIIYLVGYNDKSRWTDILGLTIYGFDVEEINTGHIEFINETMLRVFRNGGFLLCSCNGGDPEEDVYIKHLNQCRPLDKWADEIPAETWKELNRSEPNPRYRYYFFTFKDNPTMKQDEIDALFESIPEGSYQYKTKLLGIRGIREGAIYADYMTEERNIVDLDLLKGNLDYLKDKGIELITIGQDVGGTDNNVFTLQLYTKGFKERIIADMLEFNDASHDKVWEEFSRWFKPYYEKYSMYIKGDFIDSAAKIMRLTMDDKLKKNYNIRCYNAYKYMITERVDAGISDLVTGRLKFTEKTRPCYNAFTKAYYKDRKTLEEEGQTTNVRGFPKHIYKDRVDSVEYGGANYQAYMTRLG